MDKGIVELDVGGKIFRTTQSTLCSVDGYFARMLQNGNWVEGKDGKPIFIDRGTITLQLFSFLNSLLPFNIADHTVFGGILTYLRSGHVLVSDVEDGMYLERLQIEADFYQLTALSEELKVELLKRNQKESDKARAVNTIQKVIGAPDADRFFNLGWTYVGNYQGNETTSCSSAGTKMEALWRMNQCTACGEHMSYEKFCKHVTFFRPTMLVIQKIDRSTAIPNSDSVRDLDLVGLVLDTSFG